MYTNYYQNSDKVTFTSTEVPESFSDLQRGIIMYNKLFVKEKNTKSL